jgi:hypothetical protein
MHDAHRLFHVQPPRYSKVTSRPFFRHFSCSVPYPRQIGLQLACHVASNPGNNINATQAPLWTLQLPHAPPNGLPPHLQKARRPRLTRRRLIRPPLSRSRGKTLEVPLPCTHGTRVVRIFSWFVARRPHGGPLLLRRRGRSAVAVGVEGLRIRVHGGALGLGGSVGGRGA